MKDSAREKPFRADIELPEVKNSTSGSSISFFREYFGKKFFGTVIAHMNSYHLVKKSGL